MVLLPQMPERVSEQMRKDEEEQRDALAHPHVIPTDSSALCPSVESERFYIISFSLFFSSSKNQLDESPKPLY
ncbi:hypothetical protein TNCV_2481851 [Trichonephila clavipes]|nr:hypothetical protein TNCV_2481851 [Trichonephila clavipes]